MKISAIVRSAVKAIPKPKPSQIASNERYYTDHIYPYPYDFHNNLKFKGRFAYRESHDFPEHMRSSFVFHKWSMRAFWTFFFWQLFWHPEVWTGHWDEPDPSRWSDKDLGIPPDSEGLYQDWLDKQQSQVD